VLILNELHATSSNFSNFPAIERLSLAPKIVEQAPYKKKAPAVDRRFHAVSITNSYVLSREQEE
jgi:hypothetical protein